MVSKLPIIWKQTVSHLNHVSSLLNRNSVAVFFPTVRVDVGGAVLANELVSALQYGCVAI